MTTQVIVLNGGSSSGKSGTQQRWQKALGTLQVLWVGVRCASAVAASVL